MRPDFPLPDTTWEPTRQFWAAAARRELRIPRCQSCGRLSWYPSETCGECQGRDFEWALMSGRGQLFSWTVVRHAFLPQFRERVPFVTALVSLEEDSRVRLATEMIDCGPEDLRPDLPVEVVFGPLRFPGVDGEVTAPFFRPAARLR